MEYVWEQYLKRENREVRFRQAEDFCPYAETVTEEADITDEGTQTLTYNGMYRFADILGGLYEQEMPGEKPAADVCFDAISHMLLQIDLYEGISRSEYERRQLGREISSGAYGEKNRQLFQSQNARQRYIACFYLQKLLKNKESPHFFARAVVELLGSGVSYASAIAERQLYIYVGKKYTREAENTITLAENLLLPLGYQVRIFWNHHFGVMNQNSILQHGAIEII